MLSPQQVIQRAGITEALQIDLAVMKHHALLFQQALLSSIVWTINREGKFSLRIDDAVPGQTQTVRRLVHRLTDTPRGAVVACQARHIAIRQHMPAGNIRDHLPDIFYPAREIAINAVT